MQSQAVIFEKPGKLIVDQVDLTDCGKDDLVVEALWSGISTGTERMLWQGTMPQFPGMGYPLVPGYETVGEVVSADGQNKRHIGKRVFVPGSSHYKEVRGLFGGSASQLIVPADKVIETDKTLGPDAALFALAATAHHAVSLSGSNLPDLIVGCGVLGRLIARITVALGGQAPVIWETNSARRDLIDEFTIIDPAEDLDGRYDTIIDVSGDHSITDLLVQRLNPGGEIILAGFYSERINFAFAPAFMKEAKFRIAAEWKPEDIKAISNLLADGALNIGGLVSHSTPIGQAKTAYETAFNDPQCLKMILDWRGNS